MTRSPSQNGNVAGSAAVEFVFSMGIFLALIMFVLDFGRAALTRQKALGLAVFGTTLQSSNLVEAEIVSAQVQELAKDLFNPGGISYSVEMGRMTDFPGAGFYQLVSSRVRYEYQNFGGSKVFPALGGEEIAVEQKAPVGE